MHPKVDLLTNKVKFKLGTSAAYMNKFCITCQEAKNETKQVSIDEMKTLIINQCFQQKKPSNIEDLISVRIKRIFWTKEYKYYDT